MSEAIRNTGEPKFVYRILRYTADAVRDEWVNIGVLLIDRQTGDRRLRLVEQQSEIARVRRLQPAASETFLTRLRDHLEDRFEVFFQCENAESGSLAARADAVQKLVHKWDSMLSNSLQLAPEKGLYGDDADVEMERLYAEHVALARPFARVGAPNSRAEIRNYCSQVWKQARLWDQLDKAVRVHEFTFPGDPMRIDYVYRRNGTRGYVQTLSVTRAPADCKLYAYTAQRIAARAPFASEFAAVTDVALEAENERHRFVRDTLRDVGIEPVPMEGFAVWVNRLRPSLQ